jgi:MFS family permease
LDNPKPGAQRRALFVVFLVVFLDLLGVGILVPVTPFLVRPYSTDALTVGLLGFSFSAAQFLASPILGVLSDRYGRRPVLLASIVGTGIGYLMFGLAGSLLVMYISRVIDGITGGNISTAQACIADISSPEDRAKNFGLVGAAFGLGFIIGPAMGGAFSKISLSAPAFAAAGMSLITFVFAWFMLPESLPPEKRTKTPFARAELNPIRQIVSAFSRGPLRTLLFGAVSVNLAMAALQSNFGIFALEVFQVGPGRAAAIFAAIGITGAITQGVIIRRISGKFGEFSIALVGVILTVAGYAGIALSQKEIQLFPSCMLIAAGMGLIGPSVVSLLSRRVASHEQGSIMGITQSVASLTRTVGPVIAGALYDSVGKTSPYWGGAICVAIGGLLIASARD